jgi:hypothetical protein
MTTLAAIQKKVVWGALALALLPGKAVWAQPPMSSSMARQTSWTRSPAVTDPAIGADQVWAGVEGCRLS